MKMSRRDVIDEFIEKYRKSACLWQVKNKDYKNKNQRFSALQDLLLILKKEDKYANLDTVTKKINSLRSSFNKELNKVKTSHESGAEVHVPKLWYYNKLLFLIDKNCETNSSVAIVDVQESTQMSAEHEEFLETEPNSPCSQASCASSQNVSRNSKRKLENSTSELLTNIYNRLDQPTSPKQKPKYSAFGEHVAERLRCMPHDMASYCQKIINDAIFEADFGNLNHSSRIVTDSLHFETNSSRL